MDRIGVSLKNKHTHVGIWYVAEVSMEIVNKNRD